MNPQEGREQNRREHRAELHRPGLKKPVGMVLSSRGKHQTLGRLSEGVGSGERKKGRLPT